jgi:hypothetical protein
VRLRPHALAYNLANLLRIPALPDEVKHCSLTAARDQLVNIGAEIMRYARATTLQVAEVLLPRALLQQILNAIAALQPKAPHQF